VDVNSTKVENAKGYTIHLLAISVFQKHHKRGKHKPETGRSYKQ
jgi:hypothetical protein